MSCEQERWEKFHKNSAYVKELPESLSYFWKRCYHKGINPATDAFKSYSVEEFDKIKKESVKCYAYSNRFFLQLKEYHKNSKLGFALFDNKGCLLKLFGDKQFIDWCASRNIAPRTDWCEDSIGANAVSIGLENKKTLVIAGSENFCHALIDTAIYFAPYIVDDDKTTNEAILFGGIAIIVPFEDRHPDYLMLAIAAANDVSLHLFMSNSLHEVYYTETKGLISIDINTVNGKKHILYHNSSIFNVLETDYENLYFKDVETLFDPLPKNREFWDIIEKGRNITDENIPLSIKGKENNYIVTTETYWQKHLSIRGVRFFITSSKHISSNVSKRIGNNALVTFDSILGNDSKFVNCIKLAKIIAKSDSNVLILGESGVGKDIFAQAIHNASERRDKPFIVVNCAAFPRDLIASELFGYEGGAFTGSKKNGNIGKFELAHSGTIFLDEIGDMPLDLQTTLLRVIEQKSFMRLGSNTVTNINVKIIAATNANLKQLIEQKKFRADLYYRFTLHLTIPPLRERGNDIILLAEHFIQSISARIQKPNIMTLSDEAKDLLCRLPWHGNVRELQNLTEGIVQLDPIDVIEPKFIKEYLGLSDNSDLDSPDWKNPEKDSPSRGANAVSTENEITKEDMENALIYNHYNKTNTAKHLGISRKTLYRWLESLDIHL